MKSSILFFISSLLVTSCCLAGKAPDTVAVGSIKVAVKEQALLIPVSIAIDSGILEYLAVTKGGKTYESVLAADCDAKDLHAALLLINAQPGTILDSNDSMHTPIIKGDTMRIDVAYKNTKGKTVTRPAFDLVRHCDPAKHADGEMLKKKTEWVFIGSHEVDLDGLGKMTLASAMEGSLISIIIDPSVEISLSERTDNPYRGPKQGFCIDEKIVAEFPKAFMLRITKQRR